MTNPFARGGHFIGGRGEICQSTFTPSGSPKSPLTRKGRTPKGSLPRCELAQASARSCQAAATSPAAGHFLGPLVSPRDLVRLRFLLGLFTASAFSSPWLGAQRALCSDLGPGVSLAEAHFISVRAANSEKVPLQPRTPRRPPAPAPAGPSVPQGLELASRSWTPSSTWSFISAPGGSQIAFLCRKGTRSPSPGPNLHPASPSELCGSSSPSARLKSRLSSLRLARPAPPLFLSPPRTCKSPPLSSLSPPPQVRRTDRSYPWSCGGKRQAAWQPPRAKRQEWVQLGRGRRRNISGSGPWSRVLDSPSRNSYSVSLGAEVAPPSPPI